MDRTLGVVLLPVADMDRAIAFCRDGVGVHLDHRTATEQTDIAELTPPGSACSIAVGDLPARRAMAPGPLRGLQLMVSDAGAAGLRGSPAGRSSSVRSSGP